MPKQKEQKVNKKGSNTTIIQEYLFYIYFLFLLAKL